jgi:hypothetical protein
MTCVAAQDQPAAAIPSELPLFAVEITVGSKWASNVLGLAENIVLGAHADEVHMSELDLRYSADRAIPQIVRLQA